MARMTAELPPIEITIEKVKRRFRRTATAVTVTHRYGSDRSSRVLFPGDTLVITPCWEASQ